MHYGGMALSLAMGPTPRFGPYPETTQGAIAASVLAFLGSALPSSHREAALRSGHAHTGMGRVVDKIGEIEH